MLWRAARGGLLSRNALCRVPSIAPTANIPRPGRSPQPRSEGAGRCPRRGSGQRGARRARAGTSTAHPAAPGQLGRERRCLEFALGAAPRKRPNTHAAREAAARPDPRASGGVCRSLRSRTPGCDRGLFSPPFLAAQSALLLVLSPRLRNKQNQPRAGPGEFATKLRVTKSPL